MPAKDKEEKQNILMGGSKATQSKSVAKEDKIPIAKLAKLYLLPISTLIIFIGMWLILIFPAIGNIFADLDKATQINSEITERDELISKLQILSSNSSTNTDLGLVNSIAPTGISEVTDFQRRLVALAISNSLVVSETATAESRLVSSSGNDTSEGVGLIEIPSRFRIQGKLSNIKNFIAQINSLGDFVIIGEMNLQLTSTLQNQNQESVFSPTLNDDWTLNLTLVKYQFQRPTEENKLVQIFQNVDPNQSLDASVLEFIRTKFGDSN